MVAPVKLNLAEVLIKQALSVTERLGKVSLEVTQKPNWQQPFYLGIARDHVSTHPLRDLVQKRTPLVPSDFVEPLRNGAIDLGLMHYREYGFVIPASSNPASGYFDRSWIRDDAVIGLMFLELGLIDEAKEVAETLAFHFNSPGDHEQRKLFTDFLWGEGDYAAYHFKHYSKPIPNIKASIKEGKMHGYRDWAHNQLDAFGMWLFLTFRLANQDKLDLAKLDEKLNTQNDQNKIDSILSVGINFLSRVKFYDNRDHGMWEAEPQVTADNHVIDIGPEDSRTSSMGICLAAFREARKYLHENHSTNPMKIENMDYLKGLVASSIERAEATLNKRILPDGSGVRETNRHEADAALVFLLLFDPGLNDMQKQAILETIYKNRLGVYGITRREGDIYIASNYLTNPHGRGKFSNPHDKSYPHKLAEWALFDPMLYLCHSMEYRKDPKNNKHNHWMAEWHMRRMLSQVQEKDFGGRNEYAEDGDKQDFIVPRGSIVEARSEHNGTMTPTHNSPLQMGTALVAGAISDSFQTAQIHSQDDSQVTFEMAGQRPEIFVAS